MCGRGHRKASISMLFSEQKHQGQGTERRGKGDAGAESPETEVR